MTSEQKDVGDVQVSTKKLDITVLLLTTTANIVSGTIMYGSIKEKDIEYVEALVIWILVFCLL